jgi:hypothetical protein
MKLKKQLVSMMEKLVDEDDFHEVHHVEDLVEVSLSLVLPTHEDKETINSSHVDGLMKKPLDVVDEHIDTFIHIGRCIWDMGCFVFDRDFIYDIEGIFQIKNASLLRRINFHK